MSDRKMKIVRVARGAPTTPAVDMPDLPPSRGTKRSRMDALLPEGTGEIKSICTDNIDTFYVGYDDYVTAPECEEKLYARDGWYQGAEFRPTDITTCLAMKTDEQLMWRIINSGRSLIISGKAGSGKSNLLQRFITGCEGTHFAYTLTAPTGIAAFNVGGETLHSRLGLGLAKDDPVTLFNLICSNRRKFGRTWKFLTQTDILVVDEISMVHPEFFTKIDYLFRKSRKSGEPFGGVKLIMVGDFTQLGPIIFRKKGEPVDANEARLVLDTECWKMMKLSRMFLTRSYRQKEGDPFLDMLNEIRVGELSPASLELLRSRIDADIDISTGPVPDPVDKQGDEEMQSADREAKPPTKVYKMKPMDVFPYKKQVDRCNRAHLDLLVERDGEEIRPFFPALRVAKREHARSLDMKEYERGKFLISKDGIQQLHGQFPLFHLKLAVGAQVMMRCNKYMDLGIFNGTMGIITGIENNFISVIFVVNGRFMDKPIEVERTDFSNRVGKTVEVIMTQYPLTLAYACTIHKTVAGDTMLFTDQGLKPIEDVSEEDGWQKKEFKLHTYAPSLETTSHVYCGDIEPTIKIRTKMGFVLEGSLEHPMMVRTEDGQEVWRLLNCMTQGDVLVMKHSLQAGPANYLSTSAYSDTAGTSSLATRYNRPDTISDALGNMMGLLVGDGSYNQSSTGIISFHTPDPTLRDRQVRVLHELFGTTIRWSEHPTKFYHVILESLYIRAFLKWCGLDYVQAFDKTVPWVISQSPVSVQKAFLQGLFDTDGGVIKTAIHFTSASEKLVRQVHLLLFNLGIVSRSVIMGERAFRIEITGTDARVYMDQIGFTVPHKIEAGQRFYDHANKYCWTNSNIGFFPDSQRIAQALRGQYDATGIGIGMQPIWRHVCEVSSGKASMHVRHISGLKTLLDLTKTPIGRELLLIEEQHKFYDPVVSITSGKCRLYDLTVPGSHSFIANGMVSSNCQGLTLDSIRIDASNCFEAGQLYVALSRVRKIEHLSLIDFDERSLLSDPRAVEFESDQRPKHHKRHKAASPEPVAATL